MSTVQQTKISDPVTKIVSTLSEYNLLPQLQREVIIDDAISSIECTEEEIEAAYQQMTEAVRGNNGQKLYDYFQQPGTNKKQTLEFVARKLKIDKFKQANWSAEVSSYFISRKKSLDKIAYSRIVHQDRGVATEIYFRLIEQEQTFTELARQYSQAQEANVYGIHNLVKVCTLDSELAPFLVNKKVGDILPPIDCHNVFLVLRIEQIIPAALDDQMHRQLLDELFEKWLKKQAGDRRSQKLILEKLGCGAV